MAALTEENEVVNTVTDDNNVEHRPEVRPNALREANIFHSALFGCPLPTSANNCNVNNTPSTTKRTPKNERLCMGGHRETIFGLSFSPDGKYLATVSQDPNICIWSVASHRLVTKLTDGLDTNHECLRVAWSKTTRGEEQYLLASAGADGRVKLWSANNSEEKLTWTCVGTCDHYLLENDEGDCAKPSEEETEKKDEEEDRPQIYALQFIHNKSTPDVNFLLTSANDCIYLWNIVEDDGTKTTNEIKQRKFLPHLSVHFSHLDEQHNVNQFGGARNPNNQLYVFDASYCETNGLLGAALSDGTCRVLSLHDGENGSFCQEQCVLSLPPNYFPGARGGHLTALSWDKSGSRLATCIASGRVVLWLLQVVDSNGAQVLQPSCLSVLEGGHDAGRPLFGVKYCGGEKEDLLLTWGVDGKVCMFDSFSLGEVKSPLCTLITHSNYPIYALDITNDEGMNSNQAGEEQKVHIAIGGGQDGGFLGNPAYLYDI